MTSTYATNVKAILSGLDTLLKSVTSFNNRVYQGYYKDLGDTYPACLYMPTRDRPKVAAVRSDHFITVDVLIFMQGGDSTPSEDVNNFIDLVGSVFETIDEAQDQAWRNCTFTDVNFAFNRDKSLIFYICLMTITFEKRW